MSIKMLSQFNRIYIGMIASLAICSALTFFITGLYFESDDINDFILDTNFVHKELKQGWEAENISVKKYVLNLNTSSPYFHFEIKWYESWDSIACIDDCQFVLRKNNQIVYQHKRDGFVSAYEINGDNRGILVIKDRSDIMFDDEYLAERGELMPIDILLLLLLATSSIIIWLFLYFPARQLKNNILHLINIQNEFAKGNLQIRADNNMAYPLCDLASNFNKTAKKIAGLVNESHIFAQAVPHEIRTPLSRIQIAVGILKKMCIEEDQQSLLINIDDYIDDLDELTSQVVMFSRLNNSKDGENEHSKRLNINNFLLNRINISDNSRKIVIETKIENIEMNFHSMHFRLLFDNIFKNALQYAKSTILISIYIKNDTFFLSVENDGNTIDDEDFKKIFLPFSRLDESRNRTTGGYGLGLAIAQAAASRLDGTITIQNSLLGGANFIFSTKYTDINHSTN